ncbi:AsmA-like C-terminal region-containing protein [Abyssalbus ytuae]|uniref:AsmA family protein n=1 Tax=Abyssalbus ytuae TaxID=2926907 RepID=A0A9E6ZU24_9FLAO|nr:AsmA-like C-terminal region-containing protein [Abyssalbus ytuae]UOB18918.1 AsmA family protein [Abyssalbus ytuae]
MKKTKKILKILAVVVVLLIGTVIALPFIFKGKIVGIIKNQVNNNINAQFDFAEADISILRNFPNATVVIKDVSLVNFEPFKGDTLFAAKETYLQMSVKELFKKSDETIIVNSFKVNGADLHLKLNNENVANYDISKSKETEEAVKEKDTTSGGFHFNVKEYEITNSNISYSNEESKFKLQLNDLAHFGKGDFSKDLFDLDTKTDSDVLMTVGDKNYLNNTHINLDAVLGIDLKENKYTFQDNKAIINRLPLIFDGYLKLIDKGQEMKIGFKTESTEFKNFLAVIPEEYSKNIDNVNTTGEFIVEGVLLGVVDDEHIPTFDVKITSENASFKYPELPKRVNNIDVSANVVNKSGLVNDTYVDINKLSFKIDQDTFSAKAKLSNLTENMLVNGEVLGTLNLANLSKAYPVPEENQLSGVLVADVKAAFDMNSVENKKYENTKIDGTFDLRDFEFSSPEMKHPVQINRANIDFNPQVIRLNKFDAKTGNTDFIATGTLNNLLGFIFSEGDIEGNFDLSSNTFSVNDFMTVEETKKEDGEVVVSDEKVKIPSFLNCTVNAQAKTVIYDNLTLKNVAGTLVIKDETATVKDLKSDVFDGKVIVNGNVSTKEETPVFKMNLGIEQFDIAKSFNGLELFKALSPIANAIEGELNSTLSLSGNLNNNLTPQLISLSGNAIAEVLTTSILPKGGKLLSGLEQKLNFINFEEINMNDVKTKLKFDNGKVSVEPFQLQYKDITIDISGSHSFDKSLNYYATINVPAQYLGSEVTSLLQKLGDEDAKNITVPVTATIGGSYSDPNISTNLTTAISGLTQQLVAKQKEKLINKGKDEVKDALSGIINKNITSKDSTKVGKDSTKTATKDVVKDAAEGLIKNIFGKKKKDSIK